MLDLGEELFDRIEIGGVLRQEEQPRAGLADGGADRPGLGRAESKRDFPRTLTPAISTDRLGVGNGIWSGGGSLCEVEG
ncbi:hypothetical protein SFHH103_psfHH103d_115 (plasmid) [Sinorhizobium fredii HH103]|uniref:Uncharacterized protein n=1 Tax=Sinorhizobium fredii (strain USDA 257) TaxID=1185652 RepID=I3XH94_SINF2|nr:hypothetical protein USDA257_p05350 [Sinorhizobium fredii USDA 257]CEO91311.1 hypothetical protein SFHH103_psfHH103d_115 [Sinorhizobium fredii HH103]